MVRKSRGKARMDFIILTVKEEIIQHIGRQFWFEIKGFSHSFGIGVRGQPVHCSGSCVFAINPFRAPLKPTPMRGIEQPLI